MADVANLQVVIGADTSDAEKGIASLGKSVGGLGSTIATAFGTAAIAGVAAFGAAVGVSIKQAADFEKTISAVGAVSGATTEQLKGLSDLALQLGKDTSFSATEAAQGIEELTKAGVSMADIMGGAAKSALDLAAAGGIDVKDAATIAAQALNIFSLKGSDMAHVANLIAGAANASAIDVTDFKFSMQAAGAVAATFGLSVDDLSVAIAEMGQAGLTGSDAGTSFKTMLLNLNPSTKAATEKMKELGIITKDGANQFFDAHGKAKGLAEIQQVLQTALKGQTAQQKAANLQILFGTDAIRAAAIMEKNGAEGANAMAEAMGKVSAEAVGAKRLDNFTGSIDKLTGSLSTVAITIGLALLPTLRKVVDGATDIVNAWMPAITLWAEGVPAAIDQTLYALQGIIDVLNGDVLFEDNPLLQLDDYFGNVLIDSLSQLGGAWRAFIQVLTTDEIPDMWSAPGQFAVDFGLTLKAIATNALPLLQGALTLVSTYVTTIFVPVMSSLWDWLAAKLGPALTWLTTTGLPLLTGAIQAAGDWLQTQYIPTLAILWDWLSTRLGAALTWLTETGWPAIQTAMSTVWSWITGSLFPTLSTLWDWLAPKLSTALTWLYETGWPALGNAANAVQNWIKDTFIPILSTLYDWLAPKLKAALDWLTVTGWPALGNAANAVQNWIQDTLMPTLSTVYDWLAPKFQYAFNWLVITGWPALQTAMTTVWSWMQDNLLPTLSTLYDWLAPKIQYAVNWLVITGWPALKNAGIELWHTLEDMNTRLHTMYDEMTQRGVFIELKAAWDDLVKVGDKLWREILAPLVGSLENTTDATGDATDSSDDFVGSLLGVVQAVRVAITWLDHLVDYMILSVDGWKALGTAAQWAATAAGKAVTGGDIPEFPDLTRRPIWLDQSPGDLPSATRHRGTAPATRSGGVGGGGGGGGGSGGGSTPPPVIVPTPSPSPGPGGGGGGGSPPPVITPGPVSSNFDMSSRSSMIASAKAMADSLNLGLPGDITAAIPIQEAGFPGTDLGRKYHNWWSIKAGPGWNGPTVDLGNVWEVINGQNVMVPAKWRVYDSDQAGMLGFRDFLQQNSRYAGALSIWNSTHDPVAFIKAVGAAGYATDPTWASKVASIAGYAGGGWAGMHGPELGLLGERGPEYVVSNRDLHGGGGHQSMTLNLAIGGRVAEQIVVEGYDLAVRRGRLPSGGLRLAGGVTG